MGQKWFLIGSVGVDSGQLMVCDPCYVDGHWVKDTAPQGHPALTLTAKGQRHYAKHPRYHSQLKAARWKFPFKWGTYDDVSPLHGMSMNDARAKGLIEEIPNPVIDEMSYRGICSVTTDTEDGAGTIGGGLAAAFRSGWGDGLYEVWGRKNAEGRIVEVRIKMG